MNHASFFNGLGGFQLAAEAVGWTNVLSCEIDPFCNKVTKYYWPNCIQYEDIKETDFSRHRGTVDVVSGGFPCQPYSHAGKRLGTADERHLWPEMLRGIREIQPGYVVGENVGGLINWSGGLVFDEIQTDLEAEGYEVLPFLLPAAGKNAPHKRDRVWIIAYSDRARLLQSEQTVSGRLPEQFNGLRFQRTHTNADGKDLEGIAQQAKAGGDRSDRSQWIAGVLGNEWSDWPTQSPICTRNDGLSARLDTTALSFPAWRRESLKGAGNAIVPQVAIEIFKAINLYQSLR